MYDKQEPRPILLLVCTLGLLAFVLISGVVVRAYYLSEIDSEYNKKVALLPNKEWEQLKKDSHLRLTGAESRVSIDTAMDLVVQEYKKSDLSLVSPK